MTCRQSKLRHITIFALGIGLLSGCSSLGPRTMDRDQINYGNSVGGAWKNQMLSNIVKLRFVDMPVFVDVGQIVSGYTLESTVTGSLGFNTSLLGENTQGLGATGKFTDRPTITYTPKTGEGFLRSLLEPVSPSHLMTLIQAGYSPELIFTWAVESINGVKNYAATIAGGSDADPRFAEFVELLTELQQSGSISFEVETDPSTEADMVLFFRDKEADARVLEKKRRAREILNLTSDQQRFRIVYSPFAMSEDVLAIQTRSVMQMLVAMSGFVEIPDGKSRSATKGNVIHPGQVRPFQVNYSSERPKDAFAAFEYRDDWYWIDHEDLLTKRVFVLMLFGTTLTNQPDNRNAPVLTIPTG